MTAKPTIRLCEWARCSTRELLTPEQRVDIAAAASVWQAAHRLPKPPLEFSGPSGEILNARQYVGVVETGGVCIEVYPKLDAAHLEAAMVGGTGAPPLLQNLLWLMEVVGDGQPLEANTGALQETPTTFLELFALLLGRNLRAELARGTLRRYQRWEDDLRAVRGRVRIGEQITRNWDRFDKIACTWDEFTPDIALNRVFRCACRFLGERVTGIETRRLLSDCREMLDDVEEVSVPVALAEAQKLRYFDRTMERFRLSFDLTVRLLSSTGHALQTASTETFVFLVDMNKLFERYTHQLLEAVFGVRVRREEPVWYLFPELDRGRIAQKPDYYLTDREGTVWIGDAKYKHLARGQETTLAFATAEDESATAAGRLLSPDDVRQLTVYAELDRRQRKVEIPARLLLLYPFVGQQRWVADTETAWNGARFTLVPVRMTPTTELADNLPSLEGI
jgi:5-methylcytosine-specific restriction enzyme subunit McrC